MDRKRIRLLAGGVAGLVVLVAVITHFALPPYLEGQIEERLEEHGGRAEVELSAVPSLRLLTGHGDRLEIEGSGLEIDFDDPDRDVFEDLNKFDEVLVDVQDVTAGPFETDSFLLEGQGDGRYRIDVDATVTGQELAQLAGGQFGPLGELIGGIAGGSLLSSAPIPVRLEGELEAKDGEVEMTSGTGTVAGIPAGPLAGIVTTAILSNL